MSSKQFKYIFLLKGENKTPHFTAHSQLSQNDFRAFVSSHVTFLSYGPTKNFKSKFFNLSYPRTENTVFLTNRDLNV